AGEHQSGPAGGGHEVGRAGFAGLLGGRVVCQRCSFRLPGAGVHHGTLAGILGNAMRSEPQMVSPAEIGSSAAQVLDALPDPVVVLDIDLDDPHEPWSVVWAGRALLAATGYDAAALREATV